jgi:predicted RNase H-like nuclease (RuvC/YqgF family)
MTKSPNSEGISIALKCMFDSDNQLGIVNSYCCNCYAKRPQVASLNTTVQTLTKEIESLKEQLKKQKEAADGQLKESQSLKTQLNQSQVENSSLKSQLEKLVLEEKSNRLLSAETKRQMQLMDSLISKAEVGFPNNSKIEFGFDFSTVRKNTIETIQPFVANLSKETLSELQKRVETIEQDKTKQQSEINKIKKESNESYLKNKVDQSTINQKDKPILTFVSQLEEIIKNAKELKQCITDAIKGESK